MCLPPRFTLYKDVSGDRVLTTGVAHVIMISNQAAVWGPVGTPRAL